MDEDKPKLGYQFADELGKEFRKIGTAGYPIHCRDKSGKVFSIVGLETEHLSESTGGYQTWILVEEN
jgi:hypothetical protein